jgi:ribosome biogenesis ATPase
LAASVDVRAIAADRRATGFSGADIASLVREAAVAALKESFDSNV